MRRLFSNLPFLTLLGFFILTSAVVADAQRPNSREVRDTVRGLNAAIDDFDATLMFRLRSMSSPRNVVQDAGNGISNLKQAVRAFEQNLDARRENQNDVNDIITAAQDVGGFMQSNPQDSRIQSNWDDITRSIDRLASNYGVTPNWNRRISSASQPIYNDDNNYSPAPVGYSAGLTGTYQLDRSRSEQTADIIAGVSVSGTNRQDLESKLDAPDQIAISVRGDQVTLASSNAAPVTFPADGRERVEQVNGRSVRVRASVRGDELTVSSLGGETDYTITFLAENGGRSLKVTRRITTPYLAETIFADSIYNKTDQIARLGINEGGHDAGQYSTNDPQDRDNRDWNTDDDAGYSTNVPATGTTGGANMPNPTLSQPRIGEFIVPNGTVITGMLDNQIDTGASQNFDRFKMTVQSPVAFRGAVVEGYISGVGRSGQVSGRSNVTFNFERITLRDGRAYDFAGTLQSVRDHTGKEVRIDSEGTAQGDSQTRETVRRGGIGAGLGAVIGAIAGGAKGAAIGAIIGGGAGAGSVAVMGRDDIRLQQGSMLTVQSSSPITRNDGPR